MTQKPYQVDLMLAVREHIQANPESHDQAYWAQRKGCGTTYCIAGWAALLSGHRAEWLGDEEVITLYLEGDGPPIDRQIPGVARQALGLNRAEGLHLFMENDNDAALALLDRMIEAGKNGERVEL
jgi:hypothetical protein